MDGQTRTQKDASHVAAVLSTRGAAMRVTCAVFLQPRNQRIEKKTRRSKRERNPLQEKAQKSAKRNCAPQLKREAPNYAASGGESFAADTEKI